MNGPTLLVLAGIAAVVMQPDAPQLEKIRADFEGIPAYIRSEVYRGGFTLSWDCQELRKDATDAPDRAKSVWRHIRSNMLYTLSDGYQIARRLHFRREVVSNPAPADPNQASTRKAD